MPRFPKGDSVRHCSRGATKTGSRLGRTAGHIFHEDPVARHMLASAAGTKFFRQVGRVNHGPMNTHARSRHNAYAIR